VTAAPVEVLYLDHEGGWGGASRSLYYLVTSLDRSRYHATVWHRQAGPLADKLAAQSIAARRDPDLFNLTPRAASHPGNWLVAMPRLPALMRAARRIHAFPAALLHFNYEGLVPIGLALDRLGDRRPRVLHVRVLNHLNAMLRGFASYVNRAFQHVIFITENERDRLVAAGFRANDRNHSVLYNPVSPELFTIASTPPEHVLRVSFFGTLDWIRGVDRLIEVALRLKQMNCRVRIDLYGRGPRYRRLFILERDEEQRLRSAIAAADVFDVISLQGHTATPEHEMATSHLVVRPSRGADPWGRDVIESMSLATPVLASGSYGGYIRDGETGFLVGDWDAGRVAAIIADLAAHPARCRTMGEAARARARQLFDPIRYSASVQNIYDRLLSGER
jgi:glycosyltransferase involved in cell wall biosynthesis